MTVNMRENPARELLARQTEEYLNRGEKIRFYASAWTEENELHDDTVIQVDRPKPKVKRETVSVIDSSPPLTDPGWKEVPGWPGYLAHKEGWVWSDKVKKMMLPTVNSKRIRFNSGKKYYRPSVREVIVMTFGDDA